MALNLKNPDVEQLARDLAQETGESLTEAVRRALAERLEAVRRRRTQAAVYSRVEAIQSFVRELPLLDTRRDEEILGYDEHGLPR
ncbi:MAG: type II toxin-antitoxin system VapB family antitoxin [Gemmatimonadaceae bacterium]